MRPLELSIKVDAVDHYIYRGYIYIALSDGGIIRVSLNDIYNNLISKYPNYSGVITLAYRRNNFWNTDSAKCFLSIPEVKKTLMEVWDNVSANIIFEVDLNDLDPVTIVKEVKGEILDIDIYADNLLLGCTDGFFSVRLDHPINKKNKLKLSRKFDAKIYKIASAYGNSILSLGNDGLVAADILTNRFVSDKVIRENVSFASNWTAAGGLMNYSSANEFQFIGNKMQRSKEAPEKYHIAQFDTSFKDFNALISTQDIIASQIKMGFNNREKQFYLLSDGTIFSSEVKVKSGTISKLKPIISSQVKFDYNLLGNPLSGIMVADQPIIEFEDKLILINNNEQFIIEDEGIVSMHSYPRSTHFRDIISVTAEECVNLHAINVFDYEPDKLFPRPNEYPFIYSNGQ